jgi:hypothetical protein
MTLFMILLDYKYRQTSRMAPPPGPDAGRQKSERRSVQRAMPGLIMVAGAFVIAAGLLHERVQRARLLSKTDPDRL